MNNTKLKTVAEKLYRHGKAILESEVENSWVWNRENYKNFTAALKEYEEEKEKCKKKKRRTKKSKAKKKKI